MRLGASEEDRDSGFTSNRRGDIDALATLKRLSELLRHHPTPHYSFQVALAPT